MTNDVTAADTKQDDGNNTSIIASIGDPLLPPPLNTSFGSVLQVFYPSGSVNPGNDPVGGADFYASPLNLDAARSVTLEYSVLFPSGFQWVKGGKLPGLYGGHMTCSGGDDATSCFSTRLMWREDGAGELYLVSISALYPKCSHSFSHQYAPKDMQTKALCQTPPFSYCDEDYGLSIGRGSFNFTPGAWTTLRQTVTLNTPGQQDGGFLLEVDGKLAIHREDVFYRALPSPSSSTTALSGSQSPISTSQPGILEPLLGDVLRRVGLEDEGLLTVEESQYGDPFPSSFAQMTPMDDVTLNTLHTVPNTPVTTVTEHEDGPDVTITSYLFENAKVQSVAVVPMNLQAAPKSTAAPAVSFSGLFFR